MEYFGAPFAGWQTQENAHSVQDELERAMAVVLHQPVRVTGAGRTDTGVHAIGQVVHFDFDGELEPRRLGHSLNALLRPHIQVRRAEACSPEFHARYDALSRRYLYRIALRPTVFLRDWSWQAIYRLDLEKFRIELESAVGQHNFSPFSIPRNDGKSTVCNLIRTETLQDGDFFLIRVEADRFLHKMVRSLVGACFDVARGAHSPGLVKAILKDDFQEPRTWAPAQGLCLEKVTYADYDV
jgi:tRNA pseudouridine38-40 synthase